MGNIKQSATIAGVTPMELYDAFLDSRTHSTMTGARARASGRVGGAWTAWDGSLSGTNLALVPGERIVQSWRGFDFPPGQHSTVTLKFSRAGSATRVDLRQTGVPEDLVASYDEGWREFYWRPMNAYFGRRRMRTSTGGPKTVPSRSRPTKPPAKVIHARKAAALRSGGGRLSAKMRRAFDAEPRVERRKPARTPKHGPVTRGTRAGKRVPRRAKKGTPQR